MPACKQLGAKPVTPMWYQHNPTYCKQPRPFWTTARHTCTAATCAEYWLDEMAELHGSRAEALAHMVAGHMEVATAHTGQPALLVRPSRGTWPDRLGNG